MSCYRTRAVVLFSFSRLLLAQIPTTATLSSVTPNAPIFGQTVTLTAIIVPSAAHGTVSFTMDGGALLGVGTLNAGGVATTSTLSMPVGHHSLRAVYGGGGGYQPSQSTAQSYTVTAVASTTFGSLLSYPTALSPTSIATGDFNGDGRADLAVVNGSVNTLSVLLGNGDGTFQARTEYSTGVSPTAVVVGDFNGDGNLDLGTANYSSCVSVLLGNGDGTFQSAINYAAGTAPTSIVVADFNGDGKEDLVTGNSAPSVSVLIGNGDGTFQSPANYGLGSSVASIVAADFNGDGKADLAAAEYSGQAISVLLGNGDGTLQDAVDYSLVNLAYTQVNPYSIVAGDFNGDGKADLATGNVSGGQRTVTVLLGTGNGTFQTPEYSAGYVSALGDFNGDGKTDLVGADYGLLSVKFGNGDGTFQAPVNYRNVFLFPYPNFDNLAVADFNGDGKADVAITNYVYDSANVLLGDVTLPIQVAITSTPPGAAFTINGAGCATGLYTTPVNFVWDGNADCSVYFVTPQVISGKTYSFSTSTDTFSGPGWPLIQDQYSNNPRHVETSIIGRGRDVTINGAFVPPPGVAVGPNSGSGPAQTFTATFTAEPGGFDHFQWVQMLFAVAADGGGQSYCYLHYDVVAGSFWLYSDVLGFFKGPEQPNEPSNSLQGSLCAVNTLGSSVTGTANQLIVTASLIFKKTLPVNVYLRAYSSSGIDSGWMQAGTWTSVATSNGTMTASPSSGSVTNSTQQTFTLSYPDTSTPGFTGAAFGWEQFLVAVASNGGGQPFCYLHYDRGANGLWMYSSDVGFFLGPVTPGTASNLLTSSACSVNTAGSSVQNTGGNLVLTVPLTLKAPMVGAQNLYERALTVLNVDTGFVQTGTVSVN